MNFRSRRLAGIVVVTLVIGGCIRIPERTATITAPAIPAQWSAGTEWQSKASIDRWLDTFQDACLKQLVAEGLAGNYDLQASAARVQEALAQARIEGASRLPQADLKASGERLQGNFIGVDGEPAHFLTNRFRRGVDISWELDVWGRIRASRDAARAEAVAAQRDFEAARLSLAARIAQAWFRLVEARQQMEVAGSSIKNRRTDRGPGPRAL